VPKLLAGLAGIAALAAGIFGNVEPLICMQRALIAFVIGGCLGAIWQALTSVPVRLPEGGDSSLTAQDSEDELKQAA
jgi:hypothetical protein